MHSSIRYALSISLALSLFSGCAPQPAPQKTVTIDSTLPTPSLNGFIADITSIAFEWKPLEDPRVSGYYVYRNTPGAEDQKLQRIATIDSRFATHFVDTDLKPGSEYQYRFSAITANGTESVASETMLVATQPMIAPVSFFQAVGNMPRSAKLLWRPHPNGKINGYIIERQDATDQKWNVIATITGRLNAEYIDRDLKDAQVYHYRIKATTFDKLTTEASEVSKVITKPLPPEIRNITSTNDLPRAITLKWDPSTISDLSHYNIYRSSTPNGSFDYHAKLETTTFTDNITEDGKFYFYKITAVDKDGLESLQSSVATQGSTLSKPQTPIAYEGKIVNKVAELQWKNTDPRTVSYTVIKTTKTSWISRETIDINNITDTNFRDTDVKADTTYLYEIVSVDKNGIRSLPTQAIELSYEAK
ncbi:MAG: fibronectin type III domain-containing protein [Sulfuricurvum sp.]|uniref:fibronectin type III domain-containing protein n=1 Tax=Sulfuricurvum sp. TaxID=2025608 RepID=UPI0025E090F9|nr:fibronectin type III domain-containing protein [Sulfuricurvum sp.]MCI4405829.1 fibronectin type III domain-containing protein [Sulfuricurvum sp.]